VTSNLSSVPLPSSHFLASSTLYVTPPTTYFPPTARYSCHLKQFSQLLIFNYPEDDGSMLCRNMSNKSPTSTSSCSTTLTTLWKHQITQSLNC